MADLSNNLYNGFHENFYYYQRNIRDYEDNIHDYNNNMSAYLTIMNNYFLNGQSSRPSRHSRPSIHSRPLRPTTSQTPALDYLLQSANARPFTAIASTLRNLIQRRDEGDTFTNSFEDVIVRPTREQIEQATELILYDNSLHHSSCSITLESFQQGEQVCRIIHCGHMFKQTAIQEWFQRNVRCPVCRYDIRQTRTSERQSQEEEEKIDDTEFDSVIEELNREQRETTEPLSPNVSNILTGAIRNFVNSELRRIPQNIPFNELIYTFDIPIDISNNQYYIG